MTANKSTGTVADEASQGRARAIAKALKALTARRDQNPLDSTGGFSDFGCWGPSFDVPAAHSFRFHGEISPGVRALARLRTFQHWGDNWDAEGAPAPDPRAIELASIVLGQLQSYPMVPTAMLDARGQPFLLLTYAGGEGEISVVGPHELEFVLDIPGDEAEAETDLEMPGSALPDNLRQVLKRVFSKDAR